MSDRITAEHLRRVAFIYVRQSTGYQVRNNKESQRRQYALEARARQLGFSQVVVVDDDLGRSGSGMQERPGFGKLLAAVCQGIAGAVFALEASRLARNNRDWHHLVDLCALTDTLLVDDDGIYDPRQVNDRLLLGLKGSMAEFELGLLRQRAREAFEQKAKRGCAMWELPVGFVRTEDFRVEKTADRQMQQAIEDMFTKFRELGSARQTMLWYRDEHIPLPHVQPGTSGTSVHWRLPSENRICQMLNNPYYAGAFAYGRTVIKTVVEEGRARKSHQQKQPLEKWKVLILDHHSGYITWDDYLENQRTLEANSSMRKGSTGGPAKNGPALLSGLLRCGRCGRKLFVAYGGTGGRVPRYNCHGGRVDRGSASCLSICGLRVDRAVSEQVIEAVQPVGVQAALAAMDKALHDDDEKRRSLELALEKARYEAKRAQRQFDAIDPDNRLVAAELEARWNEALSSVVELEARIESLEDTRSELDAVQKERLLELGSDLASLWDHAHASVELKKRVLRTVLEEIVISNIDDPPEHVMQLHWKGGVHTELRVERNRSGKHRNITDRTAIDLIGELSKVCSDQTIAATLNRLGYRTGVGKTWRVHSVHSTRYYYRLPNYRNCKDWLTIEQAAKELKVSQTVIRRLIKEKTLPANQVVDLAPWVISRKDLSRPEVQQEIEAVRGGRQLRKTHRDQKELPFK